MLTERPIEIMMLLQKSGFQTCAFDASGGELVAAEKNDAGDKRSCKKIPEERDGGDETRLQSLWGLGIPSGHPDAEIRHDKEDQRRKKRAGQHGRDRASLAHRDADQTDQKDRAPSKDDGIVHAKEQVADDHQGERHDDRQSAVRQVRGGKKRYRGHGSDIRDMGQKSA